MARTRVAMAQLQRLMLLEIRKQEGCADVTDVGIYHVNDERAENNWSASVGWLRKRSA
jgi:hypothetical protein